MHDLEANHGLLGLPQVGPVVQGEQVLALAQDVAEVLQHGDWLQKGRRCDVNVQCEPVLARPQALLVSQPHLRAPPPSGERQGLGFRAGWSTRP